MRLLDCHTHTNHSPDADQNATVSAMCERAASLPLAVYAVTNHCECLEYEKLGCDEKIPDSLRLTRQWREQHPGPMTVVAGVELGQINHDYARAEEVLTLPGLDFVIGSVHNLKGMKDFAFLSFQNQEEKQRLAEANRLLDLYYQEMLEICQWGKFDILGHLTYPLRYIVGNQKIPVDMKPHEEIIREIFRLLIDKGLGMEINTSGLRQAYGKPFPELFYLKMYREMGGEILSTGSDAHCVRDLGAGLEEGTELAREAGFSYLCYYLERKPHFMKI